MGKRKRKGIGRRYKAGTGPQKYFLLMSIAATKSGEIVRWRMSALMSSLMIVGVTQNNVKTTL